MVWAILILIPLALAISLPMTAVMRALGHRMRALDAAGVPGQVKFAARKVPNTGGVAIFLAVVVPMIAAITFIWGFVDNKTVADYYPPLADYWPGIRAQTLDAFLLLGAMLILHLLGLVDDRKPLPAYPKLIAMLALAAIVCVVTKSRLLTLLDPYVGGPWLSYLITVCWIVVIT